MPWNPSDAKRHTKYADTPAKQKRWASEGNSALKKGDSERVAIMKANRSVHPIKKKRK